MQVELVACVRVVASRAVLNMYASVCVCFYVYHRVRDIFSARVCVCVFRLSRRRRRRRQSAIRLVYGETRTDSISALKL